MGAYCVAPAQAHLEFEIWLLLVALDQLGYCFAKLFQFTLRLINELTYRWYLLIDKLQTLS